MPGVIKLSGGDLASRRLVCAAAESERGAVVMGRMRNLEQHKMAVKLSQTPPFFSVFSCLWELSRSNRSQTGEGKAPAPHPWSSSFYFWIIDFVGGEAKCGEKQNRRGLAASLASRGTCV